MGRRRMLLWLLVLCCGITLGYAVPRVVWNNILLVEVIDYQVRTYYFNGTEMETVNFGKLQRNCRWTFGYYEPYILKNVGTEPVRISYTASNIPENLSIVIMIKLPSQTYEELAPDVLWNHTLQPNDIAYWYMEILIPQNVDVGPYQLLIKWYGNLWND